MSISKNRTPGVDSARRALNILLMFGEDSPWVTIEQIAAGADVSIPSAYRFISLLRELKLVEEVGNSSYSLTPRILALAKNAERAFEIGPVLKHILDELSVTTGEAALAIKRIGTHAVCVEMVQTEHAVRLSFTPGQIMPLERGAGSKLLLATMDRNDAERYLNSIDIDSVERDNLLDELDRIAEIGWSMSSAEVDEGVWAVAAPVKIGVKTVAVLSVAGPRYRIGPEQQESIRDLVILKAQSASELLGELSSIHAGNI